MPPSHHFEWNLILYDMPIAAVRRDTLRRLIEPHSLWSFDRRCHCCAYKYSQYAIWWDALGSMHFLPASVSSGICVRVPSTQHPRMLVIYTIVWVFFRSHGISISLRPSLSADTLWHVARWSCTRRMPRRRLCCNQCRTCGSSYYKCAILSTLQSVFGVSNTLVHFHCQGPGDINVATHKHT